MISKNSRMIPNVTIEMAEKSISKIFENGTKNHDLGSEKRAQTAHDTSRPVPVPVIPGA